jgi:hypothetical protein
MQICEQFCIETAKKCIIESNFIAFRKLYLYLYSEIPLMVSVNILIFMNITC